MSIDFVPDKDIPMPKLLTFNHMGVKVDKIIDGSVLLTDGTNFMWVYPANEKETSTDLNKNHIDISSEFIYEGMMFSVYGGNNPITIIEAVEDYFNVVIDRCYRAIP